MTGMHPDYQPEDLIEVKIGADLFKARVRGTTSRRVLIEALDPETHGGYRYCDFGDVVDLLERPATGEAVA